MNGKRNPVDLWRSLKEDALREQVDELRGMSGQEIEAGLRAAGVDPRGLIPDPGRPTTTKTRVIAHSQQAIRMD